MNNARDNGIQGKAKLFSLPTYLAITGYMLIALLIRIVAWSPLVVLLIPPVGWSIQWLSLLCPVLLITLVLPLRFSFANAMMVAAQGGSFSILRALRLSHYRKKLRASLLHALRILCWGLPFMLMLGWLYYVVVIMDAFTMMRMFGVLGNGAAAVLSKVINFFTGIFGGSTLQWEGGFIEGLYLAAGILVLTLLVLIWGIWRCSVVRYLWAARTRGSRGKIRNSLRGHRWKQFFSGLYNLVLWLPTLLFAFLVALFVQSQLIDLVSVFFEKKSLPPITFPQGVWILCAIGGFFHLMILPLRRSVTANLVATANR